MPDPGARSPHEVAAAAETGLTTESSITTGGELLVSLVANLPGSAVFVLDEDLRYVLAQGQALRDAGLSEHDLVGLTPLEAFGSELAKLYEPGLRGVLDDNRSFVVEHEAHGRAFVSHGRPLPGGPGGRHALIVWHDITERRAAEAARPETEARWAFLVDLNDRLRAMADPDAIQFEAASALGTYLGASRVGYAQDLGDGESIAVTRNYLDQATEVRGIEGRYRYDDYGPELLRAFRVGRTVVRPDIAADPSLTPAEKQAHAALGLAATVNLPLVKDGRLMAVLFVHQNRPREWTPAELQLMRDVAERTWAAVERARAESALREREERYRSLFLSIDEGFALCEIILDDAGTPVDYRFLEVNPRFEQLVGLSEAVGRTACELIPTLDPGCVRTYARVAVERETLRFQDWSTLSGLWLDVAAAPVGPVGRFALVVDDVTERRRAELALRESEERFRLTVETVPQSVWVSRSDGTIEFVNRYWTEYSGLDLSACSDDGTLGEAIHPEDRADVFGRWKESVATGEPFEMEARLRDRHGSHRWFIIRTMPLRDDEDRIATWYGVATDVHALRVAEQEAALARADAERSHQRIHRLQQLTARLAGALTPEEVANLLVTEVSAVLAADAAWVTLPGAHPDAGRLVRSFGISRELPELHPVVPADGPEGKAAASPWWLSSRSEIDQYVPRLAALDPEVASAAVISLVLDGHQLGTLCLSFRSERTFNAADRDFLLTATRLSAGVLIRASAYATEHQAAALLQESLLANEPPPLPGAQVSVRYRPAAEQYKVGGDWYEVVALPDGRVGLSVGDVVGSGITAATAMGQLRSATTAIALEGAEPGQLLRRLEQFAERTTGAAYATTSYALVDVGSRKITYACAGHPPPLVVAADGTTTFLWGGRSTPLGATPPRPPDNQACATLPPGSRLLVYSDGLVERRGEPIDVGLERLAETAAAVRELPLEWFSDALVKRMFCDAPQHDDVALLVFEPAPAAAPGLVVRVPALPRELAPLRHRLRGWLAAEQLGPSTVGAALLACGEAAANAVEHAYLQRAVGDMAVTATRPSPTSIVVTVRDFGAWRHVRAEGNRGRGMTIIRHLVEEVDYAVRPDGTEVRMLLRVAAEEDQP